MNCQRMRNQLQRELDNELSAAEQAELDAHLAECEVCSRERVWMRLPGNLARSMPAVEPSPFFYPKLKAFIEGERRSAVAGQVLIGLWQKVIPAFAVVTLTLLAVLVYQQVYLAGADVHQAYEGLYSSGEQSVMIIDGRNEITVDRVLLSLVDREGAMPDEKSGIEKK